MNRKGFRDPRSDDLAAYALGALDPEERRQVEDLLARSEEARRELAGMLDITAALASALPAAEPPPGLRARLLAEAERQLSAPLKLRPGADGAGGGETGRLAVVGRARAGSGAWKLSPGRAAFAASLAALAAAIVVAVVFGVRTSRLQSDMDAVNARMEQDRAAMTDVAATTAALKSEAAVAAEQAGAQQEQVSRLAQANATLQATVRDQRWITYVTFNRNWESPSWFRPGAEAPQAQGQIIVSPIGDHAALFVDGMPSLPEGYHYKLWLTGPDWQWQAATFTVDGYGYARVDIGLPGGVAQFTNAVITRESSLGPEAPRVEVLSAPANR